MKIRIIWLLILWGLLFVFDVISMYQICSAVFEGKSVPTTSIVIVILATINMTKIHFNINKQRAAHKKTISR